MHRTFLIGRYSVGSQRFLLDSWLIPARFWALPPRSPTIFPSRAQCQDDSAADSAQVIAPVDSGGGQRGADIQAS